MDIMELKKLLASDDIAERTSAIDEFQRLEAEISERDKKLSDMEAKNAEYKEKVASLRDSNQKLFLKVGASHEAITEQGGDIWSKPQDEITLDNIIAKAREKVEAKLHG